MKETTTTTLDALIPRIYAARWIEEHGGVATPEAVDKFLKEWTEKCEKERKENTCSECGRDCDC